MPKICRECGSEFENRKGLVCPPCHVKVGTNRRREKRKAAIELLGNKCADCGKTYPPSVYDFHHNGDKKENVATLIHSNRKLETILNEAAKCELLCANCHRIRHFL